MVEYSATKTCEGETMDKDQMTRANEAYELIRDGFTERTDSLYQKHMALAKMAKGIDILRDVVFEE